MPKLICKEIWFYSHGDEASFFHFAEGIKGVRKIGGVRDETHIHISAKLSDKALRDILALFLRYKINMRQLRQFETAKNRVWFRDPKKYWHKKVYGTMH